MEINFSKYHGCGNDFIIIGLDEIKKISNISLFTKKICDRNFGIGANGLIYPTLVNNEFKMNYINEDGSKANMCGNGLRCFVKYLHDEKLVTNKSFTVLTEKNCFEVEYNFEFISVNMQEGQEINTMEINEQLCHYTYMHVPHLQIFVDEISDNISCDVKQLQINKFFKDGTNINFIQILEPQVLKICTWERGCGLTLACGSGVCASVWTYIQDNLHLINTNIKVIVPGGELNILVNNEKQIIMQGPASVIASGIYKGVENVKY